MSNQALNAAANAADKKAAAKASKAQGANAEKANQSADLAGAEAGAGAGNTAGANGSDDDETDETDETGPAADGTQKVYVLSGEGLPADLAPFTRFSLARKAMKAAIDKGHTVTIATRRAKVTKQVSVTLA